MRKREQDSTIKELDENAPSRLTTVVRRVSGAVEGARAGVTKSAHSGIAMFKARLPGTIKATQTGAQATTTALQALPDSTLRWLAASSVGLGAGLFIAGKQRLLIAAGVAPALIMGVAIALRPAKPVAPTAVKP